MLIIEVLTLKVLLMGKKLMNNKNKTVIILQAVTALKNVVIISLKKFIQKNFKLSFELKNIDQE